MSGDLLVEARGLWKTFAGGRHRLTARLRRQPARQLYAVRGIDLAVRRGEILGLIGESGCGKTTTARLLTHLEDCTDGRILLAGEDLSAARGAVKQRMRRRVQIIFQDPYDALNPGMRVLDSLAEPLQAHERSLSGRELRSRIEAMLELVDLRPPRDFVFRYPHQLSGGQRQRVAIGRALILEPELVVADEPTSMLDVSVRSGILNLLLRLRRELGLTMVFITHDLATASYMCDRIAVMYQGEIVEIGPARDVIAAPRHPYTRALVTVVRDLDHFIAHRDELIGEGEVDATALPSGCPFAPRCPEVEDICWPTPPGMRTVTPGDLGRRHAAACVHVPRTDADDVPVPPDADQMEAS